MDYRFLTKPEVVDEQERQLMLYGGGEPGILDHGKLDGAVHLPQQTFGEAYLLEDVFAMASGYMVYLVVDHAFEQGNKRIGLAAAILFLRLNGVELTADNQSLIDLTIKVASGQLQREAVADFFRCHQQPGAEFGGDDKQRLLFATAWMHSNFAPAFRKLAE